MLKWVSIFFFLLFGVTMLFLCTTSVLQTKQSFDMKGNIKPSYVKVDQIYEVNNRMNDAAYKIISQNFFNFFTADVAKTCDLCETSFKCMLDQCPIAEENKKQNGPYYKVFIADQKLQNNKPELTQTRRIQGNQDVYIAHNNDWIFDENQNSEAMVYKISGVPERFTGHNESNVWNEIYKGNLEHTKFPTSGTHEQFLYKIISGLHASISLHISHYYDSDYEYDQASKKYDKSSVYKNHTVFYERVGKYPERVENMFYLYMFVIHAIDNLEKYLPYYIYDSENIKANDLIQKQMKKLSYSIDLLPDPEKIDSDLFSSINKSDFAKIIKSRFQNITQLLDCIQCNTCKFNGKLQFTGLAAMLKILFNDDKHIEITDNEMVALMHLFKRLSNSVNWYKEYRSSETRYRIFVVFIFCILALFAICMLIVAIWIVFFNNNKNKEDTIPLKKPQENS